LLIRAAAQFDARAGHGAAGFIRQKTSNPAAKSTGL
jgi:hypothetical protein